jgi:hypothetical protein
MSAEVHDLTPQLVARWEMVTPDLAQDLLGGNTRNRNLSLGHVTSIARDIANGDWQANGETVKVAADGTLLDGQHRLAAVVEAGTAVPMLVVRNVSMRAQETMDTGRKRSFGDVLRLRNEANYTALATVVKVVAAYQRPGRLLSNLGGKYTSQELLRTLDSYPWLREGTAMLKHLSQPRIANLPMQAGGLGYFLFNRLDPTDAGHFFERLGSPADHQAGDPILALRNVLAGRRAAADRTELHAICAVTIKAWNRYRRGEAAQRLYFISGGAKAETFPVAI